MSMIAGVDVMSWAAFLGMKPDTLFPLLLLGIAGFFGMSKMLAPIKKSVTRITHACIEIQTVMTTNGTTLRHHLVEAPGSPLQPTPYGKELIEKSGLLNILNEQTAVLKKALQGRLPPNHTEYDVQENARALLLEQKNDPIMNPVKLYAYNNGLNVDVILKAGGLWLRDDFLGIPRTVNDEKE